MVWGFLRERDQNISASGWHSPFSKEQISKPLEKIHSFSLASGLKLNVAKCEILTLNNTEETSMCEIPVKKIKYLGIHISKNLNERQDNTFKPKIQKTKNIFNIWLQRDLWMLGRVLLSKADGISRFVYPSLSPYVKPSLCKDINNTLINFAWKNKCHHLKVAWRYWTLWMWTIPLN